jgi:hypothetical protein
VFTGRHIETAVILFLPVFVALRMFIDIPLLLRNLVIDCLPRICLRGDLFTSTLPGNALTCHDIVPISNDSINKLKFSRCFTESNMFSEM